jgi:glycine/D-amino acid oxidase-like deaminating enzyme
MKEPLAGVELVLGVELYRNSGPPPQVPTWSHIPRVFRLLSQGEVDSYNDLALIGLTENEVLLLKNNQVVWGYQIEAPAADMTKYLSWLVGGAKRQGVQIIEKRLESLKDIFGDVEIIVNCSGFGARELVNDRDFTPYKGQYFVLKGSQQSPKDYIGDDYHPGGMAYMIPRLGEVMVGGCAEKGSEDLKLTLDWSQTIRKAGLYAPWLRTCTLKDQARLPVVGIRPARASGVRLEIDPVSTPVPVIHNYGHGGSGFSLSWGCAEAVKILISKLPVQT